MAPTAVLPAVRPLFRAITRATVPGASGMDEDAWGRAEALVEDGLRERPEAVRRQIALFMRVIDGLARLRFGRGLAGLETAKAARLLEGLGRSRLLLLRRGVWGVRTLAFMGYYGQSGVQRALGYRASAGGWDARGSHQGPWPGRQGAAPPEAGVMVSAPEEGHHA